MKTEKLVSLMLMIVGIISFIIYLIWSVKFNSLDGGWGVGIWIMSVIVFATGAGTFFSSDKKY